MNKYKYLLLVVGVLVSPIASAATYDLTMHNVLFSTMTATSIDVTTLTIVDPGDGNRGSEFVDNTASCKNPASGSTSICAIGGEIYSRDTGATSRELLSTAGGDYGAFTCAAGTCSLDAAATTSYTVCEQFVTLLGTADDPLFWRANAASTITSITCIIQGTGVSPRITLAVQECTSTGASCAGVDGATTIACDPDGQADDGTLSNPSADAGDWYQLDITSIGGIPAQLTVCVDYTTP